MIHINLTVITFESWRRTRSRFRQTTISFSSIFLKHEVIWTTFHETRIYWLLIATMSSTAVSAFVALPCVVPQFKDLIKSSHRDTYRIHKDLFDEICRPIGTSENPLTVYIYKAIYRGPTTPLPPHLPRIGDGGPPCGKEKTGLFTF